MSSLLLWFSRGEIFLVSSFKLYKNIILCNKGITINVIDVGEHYLISNSETIGYSFRKEINVDPHLTARP